MPKLTDTQAILLTAAAAREDRSLLPPPATLTITAERVRKAVAALIRRELAREVEAAETMPKWREDGNLRFGVVITAAGLAAIGLEPDVPTQADDVAKPQEVVVTPTVPVSKIEQVLELLRRDEGATLAELVSTTGWLPHTTRAALTGLRKRGHVLDRRKRGEVTCYHAVVSDAVASA